MSDFWNKPRSLRDIADDLNTVFSGAEISVLKPLLERVHALEQPAPLPKP